MEKQKSGKQDQFIDIQEIVNLFVRNRYLFLASLAGALFIAFAVNALTIPRYRASTSILFKDRANQRSASTEFIAGQTYFEESMDFNNELLLLQSTSLIKEVIRNNNFHVSYFSKEDKLPLQLIPSMTEIFRNSPFTVIFDEAHGQPVNVLFYVSIRNEQEFYISAEESEVDIYDYRNEKVLYQVGQFSFSGIYRFGEEVKGDHFSFRVLLNSNYESSLYDGKDLYFSFNNIAQLAGLFRSAMKVEPKDLNTTIAEISFESSNVSLAIDFLNGLTQEYLQKNLDKKNHLAMSTIQYIDAQLAEITDSLAYTEESLQRFRRDYEVMDIGEKGTRLYQQLQLLQTEKTELERRARYYQHLEDYFAVNKDSYNLLAPSSMGIDDPNLNSMIKELTTYNSEKNALIQSNQARSPRVQTLDILIENLKATISENINYNITTARLQLEDLNSRIQQLQYEINSLPQTQRQLLGIERRFRLNDAVYTYLLEKRAEAQIASASNLPDSEVIEDARFAGQVKPKKTQNYLLAVICGLFFPVVFVQTKKALNTKIVDREELERATGLYLAGRIYHHRNTSSVVFMGNTDERIADNFRSLRTSVEFFAGDRSRKVFLVTSSMSREGKSFISLNLGSAFAKNGRKTIVLGFDLRKPSMLYKELSEETFLGLSSFLIGEARLEDILIQTPVENLSLITAGAIPPNPLELISSDRTAGLFEILRETFDCIIIDSPPVGFIPDAFVLMKHSDVNLIVVRNDYTRKKLFMESLREIRQKNIENLYLVYNDDKVPKADIKYTHLYYK
ncbi:MAG: GumC family protein [Bacteroidales bacterium]